MDCFVLLIPPTAVEVLMALLEHVIGIFLMIVELKIKIHDQYLEVEVLEV